jgi:DNA adenine methylase
MKPLFMWAGGKTKMIKKYKDHLPESFDHYVEPFLGAGAMFVWAYQKNPDATFVLNDSNNSIMRIYDSVKNDVGIFLSHLDALQDQYLPLGKPARKEFYYRIRDWHAFHYKGSTKTKEAAVLYFLMKTGFNGIWQINKNTNNRFGTPAGLLNQKERVYDPENVMRWHYALQRCKLMSGSYELTSPEVRSGSYVFLDPPYRGSFTQYGVNFDDTMQEGVISFLNDSAAKGAHAMMSNRDVGDDFFESKAGQNELAYFEVTYTAGRRKKNSDGTHSAKKAREILMIGNQK